MAGDLAQRRDLPAQLLPSPAVDGDPQDVGGSLVDRALVQGLRVRGHGGVGRPRLWILDRRGTAGAGGLEDRRRQPGRRRLPAGLLRALRRRGAGGRAVEGRSLRGEPARARGDAGPVERRAPRCHQGAGAAVDPLHEGVPRRPGGQRRDDRRLREDRGASHLPLVQFPGGVPPGAYVIGGSREGGRSHASRVIAGESRGGGATRPACSRGSREGAGARRPAGGGGGGGGGGPRVARVGGGGGGGRWRGPPEGGGGGGGRAGAPRR